MSDGLFGAIRISASGLRGPRTKMDVVSRNLANAETTRTAEGTPYRRQRAIFEQVLGDKLRRHADAMGRPVDNRLNRTHPDHMPAHAYDGGRRAPLDSPGYRRPGGRDRRAEGGGHHRLRVLRT